MLTKLLSYVLLISTVPQLVSAKVESMSIREKVSQVFLFGISGTKLNHRNTKFLRRYHPGHIIFFGHNIKTAKQVRSFIKDINNSYKKKNLIPPFIALDQEGGSVTRIKTQSGLPSALAIGEINDLRLAHDYGYASGNLIRNLGFSMNLAPVLDISDPFADSFIGTRTFGKDPTNVGLLATNYALGLLKSGILPVGKHFPGHGNVQGDSHLILPNKIISLDNLLKKDLKPFQYFFSKVPRSGIMMAHISFPNIDSKKRPTTFSKVLNQNLVRKKFSYKGLVLTDDLEMNGASSIKNLGQRAVQAFLAGSDILMIAWSQKAQRAAFRNFYKAVKTGLIPMERLNQSVTRILNFKKYFQNLPLVKNGSLENSKKSLAKIAKKTFAFHFNKIHKKKPWLEAIGTKKVVFSSNLLFLKQLKAIKSFKKLYYLDKKLSLKGLKQLIRKHPNSHKIFYVSSHHSKKIFKKLPLRIQKQILVINTLEPGTLSKRLDQKKILSLFFNYSQAGKHLVKFLNGPKRGLAYRVF